VGSFKIANISDQMNLGENKPKGALSDMQMNYLEFSSFIYRGKDFNLKISSDERSVIIKKQQFLGESCFNRCVYFFFFDIDFKIICSIIMVIRFCLDFKSKKNMK